MRKREWHDDSRHPPDGLVAEWRYIQCGINLDNGGKVVEDALNAMDSLL